MPLGMLQKIILRKAPVSARMSTESSSSQIAGLQDEIWYERTRLSDSGLEGHHTYIK
jgi:hypothetical protein